MDNQRFREKNGSARTDKKNTQASYSNYIFERHAIKEDITYYNGDLYKTTTCIKQPLNGPQKKGF